MSIISDITKFEAEHFIISSLCFLAMFSPGMLALTVYFPAQFMEISSLKLILISFAIGIPLAVPHVVGAALVVSQISGEFTQQEKYKVVPWLATIIGTFVSALFSYFLIAVAFLLGVGLKFFIVMVAVALCIAFCAWVFLHSKARNDKKA